MPSYSTEPDVIAIHSQLYDHSSKTSNDTRYRDRTIQERQSISKTIITITKYIQPCLSKYSDCFFLVSTLLVYFIPLSDCFSSYSVFYSIFFSVPFFVPSLSFHSSFDFLCHSVYSFLLFSFLLFILLPIFPPITLFSISAHLRNSIISRLYIPPINILECATNSNREGEPIIRNEGINQSPLEEVKSKKKKRKSIATSTGAMSLSLSRLATRMQDVKSFPPIGIQQRPPRTQRSMTGSVGQIKRVTCYLGHF